MKSLKNNVLIIIALTVFTVLISCSSSSKKKQEQKAEKKIVYKAENLWSTEQVFDVPESVCYDAERDILYVANISGKPTDKDGKGFISKMKTTGDVVELEWIVGLDAPKGMGVFDSKLYVTNIDELVEIDIEKGEEINRYTCEGATFANDIAISKSGIVYITDMQGGGIYQFDGKNITLFKEQGTFERPNGLFACKEYLYVGTANRVYRIDYETSDTTTYIFGTEPVDGLEKISATAFIKSDWQGRVHLVEPGKEKIELTNTIEQKVNAADIEYIPEQNLMLVPTFFDNRVVAYKISK
jgi:outer membrane protein assembly factor BamB